MTPRAQRVLIGLLVALLTLPLVVALIVLRHPRWYPLMDMAQVELRLRDVGSAHPPLVGLKGRFVLGDGTQASHPGPLAFWLMWPVYWATGANAWAMQLASVTLHAAATATALWIARRRGGVALVLGVAAMLSVLMRAYGGLTLTEAWIPHLPLLWWVVFVLAIWSITCGDLALVPVAVFAGSLCLQSHISYLGTVGGLSALASVAAGVTWARNGRPPGGRAPVRWLLAGIALGILLWTPPLVEQATRPRGNLSLLLDYFRAPGEPSIGLRSGVEVLLIHLDPWRLVTGRVLSDRAIVAGSTLPGIVLLAGWLLTAVVAVRLRQNGLVRLHAVLGSAVVLTVVSMSRILGDVWYYLVLWGWALGALLGLAAIWTLAVLVARLRVRDRSAPLRWAPGKLVLVGAIVVSTVVFAGQATQVEILRPDLSAMVNELVPPTAAALADGSIPGTGRGGRYLVTWTDQFHLGAQGWALVNELARRGFDVGTLERYQAQATPTHVRSPADATAVVNLAVGTYIDEWRNKPGAREVSFVDPRTTAERRRYDRLRATLVRQLEVADLVDLVPLIDGNMFMVAFNPKVPKAARATIVRMRRIGAPAAIFVGPPELTPGA